MSASLVQRLRDSVAQCRALDRSALLEEAAAEIERLRSLTRFYERADRSGDVACLTQEEREAVEWCVEMARIHATECDDEVAALRGLLERLK